MLRRSSAAVAPIKYEFDSNRIKGTFARSNILKTAKTVDNFKVKLKTHFIVYHLHNDMWLLFNRDIHWLTLRLEQPEVG